MKKSLIFPNWAQIGQQILCKSYITVFIRLRELATVEKKVQITVGKKCCKNNDVVTTLDSGCTTSRSLCNTDATLLQHRVPTGIRV